MTGQAIPSYGPQLAGRHFKKLECFCFTQQTLAPGEVKRMPVTFVIDADLPRDVNTVTLSYTFFEVEGRGGKGLDDRGRADWQSRARRRRCRWRRPCCRLSSASARARRTIATSATLTPVQVIVAGIIAAAVFSCLSLVDAGALHHQLMTERQLE